MTTTGTDHARRRRPVAIGLVAVLIVAVLAGLLVGAWYRTLEEGEQRADERGYEQIAVLLLRRIEREGGERLDTISEDFDAAIAAHVAIVTGDETLLSPGSPRQLGEVVAVIDEPRPLIVQRRVSQVEGRTYELFGGATSDGIRAYIARPTTAPERATTIRPALLIGWAVTVALAAAVAFAVGRRREAVLRRARQRERSLTSAIAHELRTPLGSVIASVGLLTAQSDRLPSEAVRPVELLSQELTRLRTLVEDLLELARLEAGDHAMHVEVVPLAGIVRDVLAARNWNDVVAADLDPRATVSVDRLSVSRIVLNLVDNALRHGGDEVTVRVSHHEDQVLLSVLDRGSSTEAAELRRLLDGDVTVRDAGTRPGLGLRIAQQNASLHGSTIEVSVDHERGTALMVRFPAVTPVQRTT